MSTSKTHFFIRVVNLVLLTTLGTSDELAPPKSDPVAVKEAAGLPSKKINKDGCTVVQFTVASPSMKREIKASVMLPPEYQEKSGKRFPVLYALHGMGAPFNSWLEMPKLSKELVKHPMIVVCFSGDGSSFYLDSTQKTDSQFTSFFFKELLPYIDAHYRTIAEGKGRAVTGFSMGGFGAFHYLLEQPDAFGSVSSLSGAFASLYEAPPSKEQLKTVDDWGLPALLGTFAEHPKAYQAIDLRTGINAALAKHVSLPPFYLHCGTDDDLLSQNRDMRDFLKSKNLPCEYLESDGAHNWSFWKEASVGVLEFHWKHFQAASSMAPQP